MDSRKGKKGRQRLGENDEHGVGEPFQQATKVTKTSCFSVCPEDEFLPETECSKLVDQLKTEKSYQLKGSDKVD